MSNQSDQQPVEDRSGWGYLGLLALAPIVCCAGPLVVGALGGVGATWLGGAAAGIIALAIITGWRVSRKKLGRNSTRACHTCTSTSAFPDTPPHTSIKTQWGGH